MTITSGVRAQSRTGLTGTAVAGLVWAVTMLVAAAPTALAETWKNAAGHSIEAEFRKVAGKTVIFRTPSGRDLCVPLRSLSETDRRRVLERAGRTPVPTAVQQTYQHTSAALLRARQFRDGGKITRAEFAARCRQLIRLFEKQCAEYVKHAGAGTLPKPTRERLVKQLSKP
jgi:hypothetical protein